MWSYILLILHVGVTTGSVVHILMLRPKSSIALAWITFIMTFPVVGVGLYFLIGERRIGPNRSNNIQQVRSYQKKFSSLSKTSPETFIDWSKQPEAAQSMSKLGHSMAATYAVTGNAFELFPEAHSVFTHILDDIDKAKRNIFMEFYVWSEGGYADKVALALIKAAERGVKCHILVDDIGGGKWWNSEQAKALDHAGIKLLKALPVGIFRTLVGRTDLRLHRKIIIIDEITAWTGSMNMVDPEFFKQDSGVGQWVDAMVRLQGPIVIPLAETVMGDWVVERNKSAQSLIASVDFSAAKQCGDSNMQVIASGPGQTNDALLQMILALIYAAREEIVLTTPYLIPDDSLLVALRGAAARGVDVTLVVPEKVDSFLTRHASESYFEELLGANIQIARYHHGLLHTKSISVDNALSMFGTANIDMRSMWVNYEVSLFIYDQSFTRQLRTLQQTYIDGANQIELTEWNQRSFLRKFMQNILRLASPLL
ncbi:cardiolipin synthase [Cocleimonas sp. KMM 6892]|uniref:cardiolipin synthase n=1 Tax=unclassified Cocleimonas TaxID=2639732 RepID=UPI002DB933A2|nr:MULTISPECIES: cardiolipin synthase [unclassified Cocleimonas]MEB8431655.1 cardiolipin synthase [Cocleimonas sp. KMM 6892]MEC4713573.1 cardiolipin synthase [Cocleimonas sp. KMM 6895]MEC4742904.1 cardiolipin synthase [Cocleimonas sp. KMM 6896]